MPLAAMPPPLLPLLAPRIPGQTPPDPGAPMSTDHTEAEWEAMRPMIIKMYLEDNKKLVQLMAIMESRHGFAATQQMYKKRLRKWAVRKRPYRKTDTMSVVTSPATSVAGPHSTISRAPTPAQKAQKAFPLLTVSVPTHFAGLEVVLNSVFTWSASKLETSSMVTDPMSKYLASPNLPPIQDSRTMYRTFEMVFDLFNRGEGGLAGKAAQKGFYSLEFVLTEDHPDLVWHVLDTIYDMVERDHIQLLKMFLNHATHLSRERLPAHHPLLRILQQLKSCEFETAQNREFVCYLLRQAWLRNVDLLGDHIGSSAPQHLWPYEQLIWDGRTRLRNDSALARRRQAMGNALLSLEAAVGTANANDPADSLRVEALALEFTQMDLKDKATAERMALELLERTGGDNSRINARFQAYAWKMVARLQEERQELDNAEVNLRRAIAMREAAHGTTNDLRVIRDMWVLAKLLHKAGKTEESEAVKSDALRRAESFLGTVQS